MDEDLKYFKKQVDIYKQRGGKNDKQILINLFNNYNDKGYIVNKLKFSNGFYTGDYSLSYKGVPINIKDDEIILESFFKIYMNVFDVDLIMLSKITELENEIKSLKSSSSKVTPQVKSSLLEKAEKLRKHCMEKQGNGFGYYYY